VSDFAKSLIVELYQDGGVILVAIFLLSVYLYVTAFRSLFATARIAQPYRTAESMVRKPNWSEQLKDPWRSFISEMVSYKSGSEEAIFRFKRAKNGLVRSTQSDLMRLKVSIAAAPLLGLLGTIVGMIDTFDAISYVASSNTSEMVARGISKALITTNAGLAVALPALFVTYLIRRKLRQAIVVVDTFEAAIWKGQEALAK